MVGPLDDITVLEIASWVAGPSAAALMADMGANVVKVEPLGGDGMRNKLRQPVGVTPADHPFHLDNRGKRSIAVALDDERGAELVRELALGADVVISNLIPRRATRYGLAPDDLLAANPRLIYALITGYGSTGDEADRSGFDITAFFGRTGIMSLLGEPDAPPPTSRAGQGDHPTGLALLVAILAALRERDRTGAGQVVETALLRVGTWTIGLDVQTALLDRVQPTKRGRAEAFGPMNTTYRCADGRWLNLCAQDQSKWPALCTALGRPELGDDPKYATPLDRFRNNVEIIGMLEELLASAPADDWSKALDSSGIIWERVAELPDIVDDPQARRIGMFAQVDHPTGAFETLTAPFTMSVSDVRVRGCGPDVGQHSREVLRDAGVADERVEALVQAGVIGCDDEVATSSSITDISTRYIDELIDVDPVRSARMGVALASSGLTDYSPAGVERYTDMLRRTVRDLRGAEPADEVERLGRIFLLGHLEAERALVEAGERERQVSVLAAPPSSVRMVFDLMPRETADDVALVDARLRNVPAALDGYRATLAEGLVSGRVAPKRSVLAVADQCTTWSEGFFGSFPAELDGAARAAGASYAELASWLRAASAPAATDEVACGEERYGLWARAMLGTELDLDETYEWGWAELERIEREKESECARILPGASFVEVRDHLNRNPEQVLIGADAYRQWLQDESDAATAKLNGWQFDIPEPLLRCEIGIPPEGSAAAAYYTAPSEDLSQPGRTWFPTVGKTEFPKWDQLTIAYHEAVPGHHLQIGLLRLLPLTRAHKLGFQSAHGEGWALYAERLMDELGQFDTPATRLGFLASQAFRAVRVVIDIGLHTGRPLPDGRAWTPELASEYLQRHGGYPKPFADSEVLRYISWPAQATTYKLGERSWLAGRDAARARQGASFDLKRWHSAALEMGALGLADLERELATAGSD